MDTPFVIKRYIIFESGIQKSFHVLRMYVWDGLTHFNLGELFYEKQKYDEAKGHFLKSQAACKKAGFLPSWTILSSISLARAQEKFGKAIEILRECSADGWVEKYEKELAALS